MGTVLVMLHKRPMHCLEQSVWPWVGRLPAEPQVPLLWKEGGEQLDWKHMEGQDGNLQSSSPRPYPGRGAQTASENIQESGENAAPSSTDIWGLDLEARSSDAMTTLFSGWFWTWLWGMSSLLGEHINKLQRPWWLNLKIRNWAWGTSQRPGDGCVQPMPSSCVLLRLLPLTLGHSHWAQSAPPTPILFG